MKQSQAQLLVLALALYGCSVDPSAFAGADAGPDQDPAGGGMSIVTSASLMTVLEGTTGTLDVALSAAPEAPVLVALVSADDAKLGVTPTSLLFDGDDWQLPRVVTLSGRADEDTVDESLGLVLFSTLFEGEVSVEVTVEDDDGLALVLGPSALDLGEGASAQVAVRLAAQPGAPVAVAIASSDPGAATVTPASLVFTAENWAVDQAITVTGVQDADTSAEATTITLSSPDLPMASVTTTIADDDVLGIVPSQSTLDLAEGGSATVGVQLTQAPPGNVVVSLASSAPAVATVSTLSLTFTPANWDTMQTIQVTAPADPDVADGSSTLTLSASGLTSRMIAIQIGDDDAQALVVSASTVAVAEGGTASLGVRLQYQPAANLTVDVATLAPGVATASPATLTFSPANYASAQAVIVAGTPDADGADGSTTLVVSSIAESLSQSATINVDDDDEAITLQVSTTTVSLGEAGAATFQVRLSAAPVATTTVTLASSDTSAATVSPATLTFTTASWNTNQTVTVAGVADLDAANETASVTVTSAGLTARTVAVTVTDDEVLGFQAGGASSASLGEAGSMTFTLWLSAQPLATTVVTVASSDTGAAVVSPATLVYTTANWSVPQTITITGVSDADAADESVTISASASGVATASAVVPVVDDD